MKPGICLPHYGRPIDGVHQPAVDMSLIRGRHVLRGAPAAVAGELRQLRRSA